MQLFGLALEQQEEAMNKELENLEMRRKTYETLKNATEKDLYALFDSGVFNGIYKGYISLALRYWPGIEREEIMEMAFGILETYTAQQAEAWYLNGIDPEE